uniref:Uncharacterized protein n=1 Tax=Siphoviridae sp. ctLdn10 TaxID=2827847 RepID=A0A8S5SQ93_9CAUD|nr:MAG TPA: hypothetical protein [Siphoviridae sp. ctLdn10]
MSDVLTWRSTTKSNENFNLKVGRKKDTLIYS